MISSIGERLGVAGISDAAGEAGLIVGCLGTNCFEFVNSKSCPSYDNWPLRKSEFASPRVILLIWTIERASCRAS